VGTPYTEASLRPGSILAGLQNDTTEAPALAYLGTMPKMRLLLLQLVVADPVPEIQLVAITHVTMMMLSVHHPANVP